LDKNKKAEDFVVDMQAQLKEAQENLQKVLDECAKLRYKQDLATRLIDGLKDEYIHWKGNVEILGKMMNQVVGINLISAGFIS
jgi:capsule polysaccharide export protein KpsE/RkpR